MAVTKYTMRKILQNTAEGRLLRTAAQYKTTLELYASLYREAQDENVKRAARNAILLKSQKLFELAEHHPVLGPLAEEYHQWILKNKPANS